MNNQDLTRAAALLYVCEGTKERLDKRNGRYIYSIEFTNSDPKIIELFCRFLFRVIKVKKEKIRGQLFTYPDTRVERIKSYWSKISKIPIDQFQKTIILKKKNYRFRPNPLGTFKVRYGSKTDFFRLKDMIGDVWKDFKIKG